MSRYIAEMAALITRHGDVLDWDGWVPQPLAAPPCLGCRSEACHACHRITQPGDGCCCGRLTETPC